MGWITDETRRESYAKLKPMTRQHAVLAILKKHGPCTARQIAWWLCYHDLNYVKPRLTELQYAGKIEAIDKVFDETTGRRVALWKVVEQEGEEDGAEMDQTH